MNSRGKRIFAWAMAILMAAMLVAPTISVLVRADDGEEYDSELVDSDGGDEESDELQDMLDELNDRYKQLQEQNNAIQSQINSVQDEKQRQVAIKQQIDGKINTTIAQIDTLDERIAVLEERIAEKETEMKAKQKDIDENYALFQERFRAMCMQPQASTLGLVLGADDFSQMLTRTEVVTRVAQHDQDLLAELDAQLKELGEIKADIEADKAGIEADKKVQEEKRVELDAQMATANARIQDMAAMEQEYLANKAQKDAEMKQVQAEISALIAKINETSKQTKYIGGGMQWPSATLFQRTCEYGPRFGGSDFHTGIDISGGGAYGSPVLAANAGTVKVANTAVTPGYGYGKYVIIDHGGGIQTLYAHMSALSVTVGQTVAQGEKIGEVGSTGWSTGPHIHFEIRKDGQAINPDSFTG